MNIRAILALGPVLPVIVLERLEHAVPLARALVQGGIRVLEITLRSEVALDAVRAVRDEVEGAIVGAGTLTSVADLEAACRAGAQFGVSPGLNDELLLAAGECGLPLLPGVMTASEVMLAQQRGYSTMKLFPAGPAGGPALLRAFAGPFPGVMFCPTGGIDASSAAHYLRLPNVACVGGSWLAPAAMIAAGDWQGITALARTATAQLAATHHE